MANEQEKRQQLINKLDQLQKKQLENSDELFNLIKETLQLQSTESETNRSLVPAPKVDSIDEIVYKSKLEQSSPTAEAKEPITEVVEEPQLEDPKAVEELKAPILEAIVESKIEEVVPEVEVDKTIVVEVVEDKIEEVIPEAESKESIADAIEEPKVEEPLLKAAAIEVQKELDEEVEDEHVFVGGGYEKNTTPSDYIPKPKIDLEKFIGENLISKIGIVITIIGVAIGAKYTIDHDLISPLTRIILGYVVGIGLLIVGMKLKNKYEQYSAVLVSGAMTIMYFITYAAHSFYGLIPQSVTFGLMVLFTVFTVVSALNYKQQIIAQLGLVGAYAVPFLISNGSGRADVLFTYVAIINIGILFVSFKNYWRSLYYSSFILTWLIFFSWFFTKYNGDLHFGIAFSFITITFLTFYGIYMAYKLIQKETYEVKDIVLILLNSTIFFAVGYYILSIHPVGKNLLGLFAVFNALVHFVVTILIHRQKLSDKNLFYLAGGLVLVFLTMAIPIQLDGNWVTLLWAGEAAVLFWVGRSRNVRIYEQISYPIMALALFSLIQDWSWAYGNAFQLAKTGFTPLLNINFLSSILFMGAFGFITYWLFKKEETVEQQNSGLTQMVKIAVPIVLIVISFVAFLLEINDFWSLKIFRAGDNYDIIKDLRSFKKIWVANYVAVFLSVVTAINIFKIKSNRFAMPNFAFNILAIFLFLIIGLYEYSELRESYIVNNTLGGYYIAIRYISLVFGGVLIWLTNIYAQKILHNKDLKIYFELFLYFLLVWFLSSELLHWLDLSSTEKNYKLGLSILWGVYSLMLVSIGIGKNKKYLRIGAITLFGVTLAKLFFYDLMELDTISKTIVFVSLGVLLLIISFLYNKYSSTINYEKEV